jgi:hypothetical protein
MRRPKLAKLTLILITSPTKPHDLLNKFFTKAIFATYVLGAVINSRQNPDDTKVTAPSLFLSAGAVMPMPQAFDR